MKICKTCDQTKPLTEFYTHSKNCKTCVSEKYHATKVLKGYPTYTAKPLPVERTCRICNQTKSIHGFYVSKPAQDRKSPKIETRCKSCTRDHYNTNRETILSRAASKRIPKVKPPKKTVEENRIRQAAYKRNKRQSDPMFKLRSNVGTSIANALSAGGYKKTSNTASILGCTFKEFYIHIEQQFVPGMSWANRNNWHIDHIVPLSFAENEQELLALNHYTNLRPLWSIENQNKAGMLTDDSVNHSVYKQIVANRILG